MRKLATTLSAVVLLVMIPVLSWVWIVAMQRLFAVGLAGAS